MSNASIPEELLSAYVDGQLTATEKQRAEQLIAESPPCAEFVNELRAQSRLLSDLPRFELDKGFAKRVLVAAEEKAHLVWTSSWWSIPVGGVTVTLLVL